MTALKQFRELSSKHSNTGVQILGGAIAVMAFANIFSGFSLQCIDNTTARLMNKIDILIGGAAMAFGGLIVFAARSNLIKKQEHMVIGVASLFLLAQAILSLIGQSNDEDCKKGTLSTLGNIASLVFSLIGFTSILTKK